MVREDTVVRADGLESIPCVLAHREAELVQLLLLDFPEVPDPGARELLSDPRVVVLVLSHLILELREGRRAQRVELVEEHLERGVVRVELVEV